LRDQPAAAAGVEIHHCHHVAEVELQTAVLIWYFTVLRVLRPFGFWKPERSGWQRFYIVADQVNQHLFVGVYVERKSLPVTAFEQGFLATDEGEAFG